MKRDREKEKALKVAYGKFRRGDHLTDQDIKDLLKSIGLSIPFLQASPEFGAVLRVASMDENTLYDYQQARKRNKEEEARMAKLKRKRRK